MFLFLFEEVTIVEIRQATENDLDKMVEIDRGAYGEYGANKEYFTKKLTSLPKGVLVAEDNENVTGFIIFEIMKKDDVPEDFRDIKLTKPIKGKWMYTIVFTTETNYKNKDSDSQLLLAAEKVAKSEGCIESCVPLSIKHPFKENGVFEFWEMNEYEKIGEIKWVPNLNEFVDCWFYRKELI